MFLNDVLNLWHVSQWASNVDVCNKAVIVGCFIGACDLIGAMLVERDQSGNATGRVHEGVAGGNVVIFRQGAMRACFERKYTLTNYCSIVNAEPTLFVVNLGNWKPTAEPIYAGEMPWGRLSGIVHGAKRPNEKELSYRWLERAFFFPFFFLISPFYFSNRPAVGCSDWLGVASSVH